MLENPGDTSSPVKIVELRYIFPTNKHKEFREGINFSSFLFLSFLSLALHLRVPGRSAIPRKGQDRKLEIFISTRISFLTTDSAVSRRAKANGDFIFFGGGLFRRRNFIVHPPIIAPDPRGLVVGELGLSK